MALEETTTIFKDALDLISKAVEKFAWLLFGVFLALMIAFFVWVALYAPGPVAWFYRYAMVGTILFGGGMIGFFSIRFLRSEG